MRPAQDVPGTVLLVELSGHDSGGKHASDRSDIVLVPQPSKDPEDPLNWSRKRKMWSLFMVFVYTMGVGIATTLHYSVIADIERDAGIPTVDLGEILKSNFKRWGWFCLPLVYAVNGNGVMFLFGKLDLNLFDHVKCTDEKQYVYAYSYQQIATVRVLSGDMLISN